MAQIFLVVMAEEVLGKNSVTRGKAGERVSKEDRGNRVSQSRRGRAVTPGDDIDWMSKGVGGRLRECN